MVDIFTYSIKSKVNLSSTPGIIFYNPTLQHLFVVVGDPGVIELFGTRGLRKIETVSTQNGAHTLTCNDELSKDYAFRSKTHQASVFKNK